MLRRWPARQGGYHASAECVGVLAWVAPHPPPIVLVCPTGAIIAFGALVAEAGGVTEATLIDMSPFFRSGRCDLFYSLSGVAES